MFKGRQRIAFPFFFDMASVKLQESNSTCGIRNREKGVPCPKGQVTGTSADDRLQYKVLPKTLRMLRMSRRKAVWTLLLSLKALQPLRRGGP